MWEYEFKIKLSDFENVKKRLESLTQFPPEMIFKRDLYFGLNKTSLFRLRTLESAGETKFLVTLKDKRIFNGCELNSETDFVAKNDEFQKMALNMVEAALENGDLEAVKAAQLNGKSIAENLTDLIAKIGENMSLRRTAALSVENGVVASYIHNMAAPNLGKIGVLVALESSADPARLQEVAKQVAMHIAAAAPQALDIDSMDKAAVEHEKSIYSEQARQSGKPENIIEKMIEGRIRKFYEEVVLLEQAYIMDPDKKVKDVIADASKELGTPVELKGYVRFALGEGIEKKQEDFAAEVNVQLNK